jgi:hypothetical protein
MRALSLVFALSLSATISACSPHPPTDGFYACEATGACPSSFPYCDPIEHRCYARVPDDAGPRPDSPPPDAFGSMFSGEYEGCASTTDCAAPLTCIGGSCMTGCTTSGCAGRQCVPVSMVNMATACVVNCTGGAATCPPLTRMRTVMMGQCQCVPASWP